MASQSLTYLYCNIMCCTSHTTTPGTPSPQSFVTPFTFYPHHQTKSNCITTLGTRDCNSQFIVNTTLLYYTCKYCYSFCSRYAFTTELRDTGHYGFELPKSQIIPSGEVQRCKLREGFLKKCSSPVERYNDVNLGRGS